MRRGSQAYDVHLNMVLGDVEETVFSFDLRTEKPTVRWQAFSPERAVVALLQTGRRRFSGCASPLRFLRRQSGRCL